MTVESYGVQYAIPTGGADLNNRNHFMQYHYLHFTDEEIKSQKEVKQFVQAQNQ